jgi:putative peptidoglycan lipid II flippase
MPAALGLALLSLPILVTLFQYGAFSPEDARLASLSLTAFAAGLPGFVAVKVLAPGFYARQDMRTPVRIAAVAVLGNLVFNALLVPSLAHAGLALATALAAWLNAGLLYRGLARERIHRPRPGWGRACLRVAVAGLAMSAFLVVAQGESGQWLAAGAGERALRLVGLIAGGAAIYAGMLLLLGLRPRELAAPAAGQG